MKLSDRGLFALALHEGVVPGPYKDSAGVWTYGIGHTKAAGAPDPESMQRGMPNDIDDAVKEAVEVFRKDVAKYEADVNGALDATVSQHEFDALVSFHYNTGGIRRARLTKHLNWGDRARAAKGFMGWKKPPEIIPRRYAEKKLFRDGVYPSGKVIVWGVDDTGRVLWKPRRSYSMQEFLALLRPPVEARDPLPEPQKRGDGNALPAAIAAAVAAIGGALYGWWESIVSFFGG